MTNITIDVENRLFLLAGMAQKQQPEFKVGDVVESQNNITASLGSKGVVIQENIEDRPPDYDVYWYTSGVMGVIKEDLRCCKGMKNKRLCVQCEYKFICPDLGEIVRCDISEFGEWRIEGEQDFYVCKQRKCKHLSVCVKVKWFPKSV